MPEICEAAIHLCKVRVTRLNQDGTPASGPNNVYITDKALMLQAKAIVEAGQDKVLIGGCDCPVATYRGYDKLKRYDLELDLAVIEPALLEMMTGGSAIVEGGAVAGLWWPNQLNCSNPLQPNVCFECWMDAWVDDHPAPPPVQYVHFIWPSSHWQIGDNTLQNDFLAPKLLGWTRGNPNWGLGIFNDLPEAAQAMGGFHFTNSVPTALCGYQSRPIT